ncbi:hypothetical protein EVAR_50931_1 [Eumeta japonica]|uniref:ATP-dependent DNA helicase n=1 Tax=Eumeta variegata TaxID=151549 RepID=A0A4C1Y6C5_EUMVA|nr:hypothetical protein EVAR_50931_1 [Eumeta japonica]
MASTVLKYRKTDHSTFKLPLSVNLEQQSICSICKNGPLGKLLQDASLITWAECIMSHRAHIEVVDRTLRDLRNSSTLMDGITFVFARDFRQTPRHYQKYTSRYHLSTFEIFSLMDFD